jgi:hypothetical protein
MMPMCTDLLECAGTIASTATVALDSYVCHESDDICTC